MSQSGIYHELKSVWLWARNGLQWPEGPSQVHWVLSDLCNQSCKFCTYRWDGYSSNELFVGDSERAKYGHNNPVRWVNTDRALRLIDEFKRTGILGVQLTGGGEPSIHPDFEKILRKTLHSGMKVSLVSNGYRWRNELFDLLPGLTWLRVSVDAGTKETYCNIRQTPENAWNKVWTNIERAAFNIKNRHSDCAFGIGFTATPDNWREIQLGVKLAKEHGVSNIRISAMFSPDGAKPFELIYERIRHEINTAKLKYQSNDFNVYDNFGSRLEDLIQQHPDYRHCAYQRFTTYVAGDLFVYRCCVLSYNMRGRIPGGDLNKVAFDEWWRSEERKNDMNSFDARGCPRCMFNAKNRNLLYVTGSTPSHVEFP